MRVGIAAATCLVFVVGCGSNTPGTVEAQQRDVSLTSTEPSGQANSSTDSTSSLPATADRSSQPDQSSQAVAQTRCSNFGLTYNVPIGWYANAKREKPGGTPACIALSPTDNQDPAPIAGFFLLGDEMELLGYPVIVSYASNSSAQSLVSEFLRDSGSEDRASKVGNKLSAPNTPGTFEFRDASNPASAKGVNSYRVAWTAKENVGYVDAGTKVEALVVDLGQKGVVQFTSLGVRTSDRGLVSAALDAVEMSLDVAS